MDDLKSELAELKEFIADLKADRAAAKEKERKEAWTKYVSFTVVLFAVIASIGTQWAGKSSSLNQMSQLQASDFWNFYQAQSIKQHLFELNRAQLVRSSSANDTADMQKTYDAKIKDYNDRKNDIREAAHRYEARQKAASQIGGSLALASSFFSVAIAMASLCLLTKKKPLWICSIIFAAVGIFEMIMSRLVNVPDVPKLQL